MYAPLGSLQWLPGDLGSMSLSFTLDDGSIQTRDLRSRCVEGRGRGVKKDMKIFY